jgi:transaldolase / glucose-6-phosphate isomerase
MSSPGAMSSWRDNSNIRRLWDRDSTLWTGHDESKWLGWLGIVSDQLARLGRFRELAQEVRGRGFKYALLLGMGGSSLCTEVLATSFGRIDGFPEMHVLDSTDPAQVRSVESKVDLKDTVVIVASKSGSTLEPNIFKQYFFEKAGRDGSRFIAITDPGSNMEDVAEKERFWKICHGVPSIGGRYSALSDFGMVPAAVMGIDVERFLGKARDMVAACLPDHPVDRNPGVALGVWLGEHALVGKNKLTIVASRGIYDLGAWLEQLIAESTGKNGKGIIPVDREALAGPGAYDNDRVFVYERLESSPDPAQDTAVAALEKAGFPVMRIAFPDVYHLGAEFFRWEIATAVAGSVIGINPFDQPDVEASKVVTRQLTDQFERAGLLPAESPAFEDAGLKVFGATKATTLDECLRTHLASLKPGDYFALLAYIEMNAEQESALQSIRMRVRDTKRVATCLGFGPRFLHSTGQAYKGGPNTGVFLQITCDDGDDVPIPGQKYSFSVVKAAQARGDFEVLTERKRRALRIHMGADVRAGLVTLASSIDRALK